MAGEGKSGMSERESGVRRSTETERKSGREIGIRTETEKKRKKETEMD